MKKRTAMLVAMLLCVAASAPAFAVTFFPGVTGEMTDPAYWSSRQDILATAEEIRERNEAALSSEGTHLVDLKALPETFDGAQESEKALRQARVSKAEQAGPLTAPENRWRQRLSTRQWQIPDHRIE